MSNIYNYNSYKLFNKGFLLGLIPEDRQSLRGTLPVVHSVLLKILSLLAYSIQDKRRPYEGLRVKSCDSHDGNVSLTLSIAILMTCCQCMKPVQDTIRASYLSSSLTKHVTSLPAPARSNMLVEGETINCKGHFTLWCKTDDRQSL